MSDYLFVYGTLLSELKHEMGEKLLQHAELLGSASCQGKLYRIAWYPGLVNSKFDKYKVDGELYKMHDAQALFLILDEYEGIHPEYPTEGEYRRVLRSVTFEDSTIESWVYIYQGKVVGLRWIKSGDFLADLKQNF
jgi:gamma-glutamylcyclotransferase (GGCT)/AIG2-like uncharacterized protein YtfP